MSPRSHKLPDATKKTMTKEWNTLKWERAYGNPKIVSLGVIANWLTTSKQRNFPISNSFLFIFFGDYRNCFFICKNRRCQFLVSKWLGFISIGNHFLAFSWLFPTALTSTFAIAQEFHWKAWLKSWAKINNKINDSLTITCHRFHHCSILHSLIAMLRWTLNSSDNMERSNVCLEILWNFKLKNILRKKNKS